MLALVRDCESYGHEQKIKEKQELMERGLKVKDVADIYQQGSIWARERVEGPSLAWTLWVTLATFSQICCRYGFLYVSLLPLVLFFVSFPFFLLLILLQYIQIWNIQTKIFQVQHQVFPNFLVNEEHEWIVWYMKLEVVFAIHLILTTQSIFFFFGRIGHVTYSPTKRE